MRSIRSVPFRTHKNVYTKNVKLKKYTLDFMLQMFVEIQIRGCLVFLIITP